MTEQPCGARLSSSWPFSPCAGFVARTRVKRAGQMDNCGRAPYADNPNPRGNPCGMGTGLSFIFRRAGPVRISLPAGCASVAECLDCNTHQEAVVIIVGVSSTIFVIVMVLGVLAYLHDGAMAVRRRQQRKDRIASLYGSADRSNHES